jgi:hypothetical protein
MLCTFIKFAPRRTILVPFVVVPLVLVPLVVWSGEKPVMLGTNGGGTKGVPRANVEKLENVPAVIVEKLPA